ncbi:MAG: hypothetical protein ACXACY_14340 [Candidatus Hodarchaeales archaeon]|jgi:hypothetical protein
MVYIITETWFPPDKAEEVGKLYLEAMQKFPDDRSLGKTTVQSATWTDKDGIRGLTVYTVKPGKIKEAMDQHMNRLLVLAAVEGFRFQVNVAYDVVESMPLVGLEAPAL